MIVNVMNIDVSAGIDHGPVMARLEPLRPVPPLIERRRQARPAS